MRLIWLFGCLAALVVPALPVQADVERTNIVHIFADDLGWGSVGFNGQTQIATPNLDALAAGGMRLTNSYATPVCAPSRATLYTGFHQGHSSVDGNNALKNGGFRAEDVMTAEVLDQAGYTSAVYGKWGFGADGTRSLSGSDPVPTITDPDSLPTNHGFEHFYGYLQHGAAHDYFYDWMWQNDPNAPAGVSVTANNGGPGGSPEYTHDLFAAKSEQFVANHAGEASPFYMQVSYTIPHWDIDAIANAPGGYGQYVSQPWTNKQKAYAAMITRMDASIGSLIDRLDDPDGDGNNSDSILGNTLVLFTSDNGPTVEDDSPIDFFNANGNLRGGKFELYEGGLRMPAVAYWPGTIEPGSTSDYRTDLADVMATAADLAGADAPVGIDGTSILPTLTGQGRQRQRDYLVFEHQGSRGQDSDPRIGRYAVIRQDGMKLIQYHNETIALFNLVSDPDESSPLNLGNPTNAEIVAELRAAAVAEGALRGVVQYRSYTGPNGGNVEKDASWDGIGRPHEYWSASIVNDGAAPRIAHVSDDVTTLGVEVRGQTELQVVDVHEGSTLTGRNEVRIGALGRVDLSGGALTTNRWVNIRAGGELRGHGIVVGDIYNEGHIAPGRPDEATSWPIVAPPELPPITLDTGVATAAMFDFAGIQDDVPLLATSTISPYIEVSEGLNFGPGVVPKLGNGGTDEGDEFNFMGQTGSSLAAAIDNGDYISFSVDPVDGTGILPSSVSFRVWRNGGASAKKFAILSSVDGFSSGDALVQATYTDSGLSSQHYLTASLSAVEAITEPIEFRLYGWGATNGAGNTHLNFTSLNARSLSVPTLAFDFAGVQDTAPLTALKRQDSNVSLTGGLNFGPGVTPRGANNVSNEFHIAGFSADNTLQSALAGDDYVTFSVQPITGMAMYPDSVSFNLWREASGSATDYAIFSSVDGFSAGQQLTQAVHTLEGAGNPLELTGSFANAQPTTDPVEFRLYGWNAATSLDSTHLTAASMRARFASIPGSPIDPTGELTVKGDFIHLEDGMLALELGGNEAGVDYDVLTVLGEVELAGDLIVSLGDAGGNPFAPTLGDTFEILSASEGILGEFADVTLPVLEEGLDWFLDYQSTFVALNVMHSADFNRDGFVDATDLTYWNDGYGKNTNVVKLDGDADNDGDVDGRDFLQWQKQFTPPLLASNTSTAVPEPSGVSICIFLATIVLGTKRIRNRA